jgi:hypothetical protein
MNSKIVHPTALSIAATVLPGGLDALMPSVSGEAEIDFTTIFHAVKVHVGTYGLQPKPAQS